MFLVAFQSYVPEAVLIKTLDTGRLTLQEIRIYVPSEYFNQISILKNQAIINKVSSYREHSQITEVTKTHKCR